MSEENKQLILDWLGFAQAGFVGDFERYIATDCVGHLSGQPVTDLDELKRDEKRFAAAFPDARYRVDDLIACDDSVVLRFTTHGTHHGEFMV